MRPPPRRAPHERAAAGDVLGQTRAARPRRIPYLTAQEAHTGRVDSASSARGGGGQPDGARRAQATCSQVVAVTEQRTSIPTDSGLIARTRSLSVVIECCQPIRCAITVAQHPRELRQQRPNLCLNSVSQRRQRRPHVAVLDPSGGTGVLALHPGGAEALLQEPGLVDDQHPAGLAEV